uniref:global nitrogen transcriptional regulator n=1 Tax=Chroothece richteriana TaxID=101928 RepID=UPI001FCCDC8F|nr:global nitrogen transcriptional regulator [Chroothece richteriana]UNJ14301.1 global nitrogen transcriptional regulator [Chroothece richteriana]
MLQNLPELYPDICKIVCLNKGDIILSNRSSTNIYFILEGIIQLGKNCLNDKIRTITLLQHKECFIYSQEYPTSYQLKSLTTTSILIIKVHKLKYINQYNPILFPLITYGIYKYNLGKEKFAAIFIPKTITKRIIVLLFFLAQNFGVEVADGIELSLLFSQSHIAQIIGTTRSSVNKVFQLLRRSQCLEISFNKIRIKNPVYLAQLNKKK